MRLKKRESIDVDSERDVVTAMIISTEFLTESQTFLDVGLLRLGYARTVAKWCNEYYEKYKQAPKDSIQSLFDIKSRAIKDKEQVELIRDFLSDLSGEFDENTFNAQYALDKAENYLKVRSLEGLRDDLSASLLVNDASAAELSLANYNRVGRPDSIGVDVLTDTSSIIDAIYEENEVLFQYAGALGALISYFARGELFGITAPMKRGKTYWLIDLAIRALLAKLKVLFVSLEMDKNQIMRRVYQNFLGETKDEMEIDLPYFDEDNFIDYKKVQKKGLAGGKALKKAKALKRFVRTGSLRLACFPAYSINVEDLRSHVLRMIHFEGFVPDVIITDYADIFAPERNAPKEYRHRLDMTWKSHKALAQEFHCLVATGSQSNKMTLSKDIDQGDVAEDVRKLAHVSCMVGLNQNKDDKRNNIMRVKVLVHRHEFFHVDDEVIVLEHKGIGKPYLDSRFKKDVEEYGEEENTDESGE